jgi:hypothetical protein
MTLQHWTFWHTLFMLIVISTPLSLALTYQRMSSMLQPCLFNPVTECIVDQMSSRRPPLRFHFFPRLYISVP